MKIIIDKTIYDDDCISKAVYSLADKYIIIRYGVSETSEELEITTPEELEKIKMDIFKTLNDFKLRSIIEKETHDIRTILYAKAFMDCDDIEESDLN